MKSAYKKIVAYVLVIVIGLVLIKSYKGNDIEGSKLFVKAFATIPFHVEEAELHMWGEYIPKYMQMEEMGAVVKALEERLGIIGTIPVLEESENRKTYTVTKTSLDATTKIQFVETIKPLISETYQAKNYLVINLTLHNKCKSITYFQKLLSDYFRELEIKPTTGLTITASKAGTISEVSAQGIMTQLVQALDGEVKSIYLENEIKSMYGYTRYVKEHVTANGQMINMDLAITYNELEDRTYLYGAIPVITFEY